MIVLALLWISLLVGATPISPPIAPRAQCQATLDIAQAVAQRMQSHYYNSATGQYTGGALWTDANAGCYICKVALSNGNWQSVLAGSNDDAGWIWLALVKLADYRSARGQDASPYLTAANKIYDIVAGQWDGTCGGGVYVLVHNAITNELFLTMSASGYLRNKNATYLDNAKKTWTWLINSGMRNSNGLFNDGLNSDTCANNGQTTWTYNQGTLLTGASALYIATGDSTYLTQAEISLDATISRMTTNSILKESCDNAASGAGTCNTDQQAFKGLFMKHLQFYLDGAGSRVSKYSSFIGAQTSGVYHYGTNANNDIGSVWYAPDAGGSVFTPMTSSSGLAAHIVAAKFGPC
ncbi:glycoside hydrolase family 76 protein [Flagelloscypha sp. PMI_526]|nr:glycoside hydrolase family 76 protein [Flagelloscypha sp. PMI_526]